MAKLNYAKANSVARGARDFDYRAAYDEWGDKCRQEAKQLARRLGGHADIMPPLAKPPTKPKKTPKQIAKAKRKWKKRQQWLKDHPPIPMPRGQGLLKMEVKAYKEAKTKAGR